MNFNNSLKLMAAMLFISGPAYSEGTPELRGTSGQIAKVTTVPTVSVKSAKAVVLGNRLLEANAIVVNQSPMQDSIDTLFFRTPGDLQAAVTGGGAPRDIQALLTLYVDALGKPLQEADIETFIGAASKGAQEKRYFADLLLGALYLQNGNLIDGMIHSQRALDIASNQPNFQTLSVSEASVNALSLMATGFILDNNVMQAEIALHRVLDFCESEGIRVDSFILLNNLSAAYELNGDFQTALKVAQLMALTGKQTLSQATTADYTLGRLLIKTSSYKHGINLLEGIINRPELGVLTPGAKLALADGYTNTGAHGDAIKILGNLETTISPDDHQKLAVLHGIKSDLAQRMGDEAASIAHLKKKYAIETERLKTALSKDRRQASASASTSERVNAERLNRQSAELELRETILFYTFIVLGLTLGGLILLLIYYRRSRAQSVELDKARILALKGEQAKSDFLAMMSHEIRTPLNSIIPLSGFLQNKAVDSQEIKFLGLIGKAGRDLLEQVENIFAISASSDMMVNDIRTNTLDTIFDEVILRAEECNDKGIQIQAKIDPTAQGSWALDGRKLASILGNLLSNAVKFSHATGIVEITAKESDTGGLLFSITDKGTGFDMSELGTLLEPFTQNDVSISRAHGGSGLGLPASSRLCELIGADLIFDSALGDGTHVTIHVPAQREALAIAA